MSFQDFGLDACVYAGIPSDYSEPTPIQVQAIPAVMRGADVLGLAQTGTGKTAAFVLPILHRLSTGTGPRGKVRALIIAPTRELAEQIYESIQKYGKRTGLHAATLYGGVNFLRQLNRLRRGVDIIVACPGRLLDHMEQRTIDLRSLEVLVLDEADQMFDMGFLPSIRNIIRQLPKTRQNLLFSATMPKEVRHLTAEILHQPVTVQVGNDAPVATIAHALYPIEQERKYELVVEILKKLDMQSVLIFTRTKHRAKRLGDQLKRAGYSSTSLQGGLSQSRRFEAMTGFRQGKYQILVATDIAARGIDVRSVSHVINFDIPDTVAAYTHRIGRTGRAASTGDAFTFVTREDESMVRSIERSLGSRIERRAHSLGNKPATQSLESADKTWRPWSSNSGPESSSRSGWRQSNPSKRAERDRPSRDSNRGDSAARSSGPNRFRNSRRNPRSGNSGSGGRNRFQSQPSAPRESGVF